MKTFLECLAIFLFLGEIFTTLGVGCYLSMEFDTEGIIVTIKEFFNLFKKLNLFGAIVFIVSVIFCIPAIVIAVIVAKVIDICEYVSQNKTKIFYKKEEEV